MNTSKLKIFLSPFLFLASLCYGFIIFLRNLCFKYSLFKAQRLELPVVSVGNITAGGSGKTAVVLEILKHWPSLCVLTRGYQSQVTEAKKTPALVKDSQHPNLFGDEPTLIKKKYPKTVIVVDPNRYRGAQFALESKSNIDGFVLDDGFQHQQLQRDLNILLFDVETYMKYPGILPLGRFREGFSSIKRADHILLTKWQYQDQKNIDQVRTKIQNLKIEFSFLKSKINFAENYNKQKLSSNKVILVSGLGQPLIFEKDFMTTYPDVSLQKHYKFPDHHNFKMEDLDPIIEQAKDEEYNIVCTEKDYIKIQTLNLDLDKIFYTQQELDLGEGLFLKLEKLFKRD